MDQQHPNITMAALKSDGCGRTTGTKKQMTPHISDTTKRNRERTAQFHFMR